VRDLLRRFGFESRRGIQSAGEPDQVHSIPGVHVEVKNDERLSIWAMLAQAERDAVLMGGEPVVFFKRNGTKLYVATAAEEYLSAKRTQGIALEFVELVGTIPIEEIVAEFIHLLKGDPRG